MPEKTDEEREKIVKQRTKIEGMPTTAKVTVVSGFMYVIWQHEYLEEINILVFLFFLFF